LCSGGAEPEDFYGKRKVKAMAQSIPDCRMAEKKPGVPEKISSMFYLRSSGNYLGPYYSASRGFDSLL
jgi:hypothetical protein